MEVFRFDRGEKIVRRYDSEGLRATRIAAGDGRVHLTCLTVEPGGVIGRRLPAMCPIRQQCTSQLAP